MKFDLEISVDVPKKEDAEKLAKAFETINNSLSFEDKIELAELLRKNPGIVKTAKKFLKF